LFDEKKINIQIGWLYHELTRLADIFGRGFTFWEHPVFIQHACSTNVWVADSFAHGIWSAAISEIKFCANEGSRDILRMFSEQKYFSTYKHQQLQGGPYK